MYAIYVLLFLGTFSLLAFCTLFVLGSVIHLTSAGREALRAISRTCEARAKALPGQAMQVGHPPKAVPDEVSVQGDVAYAAA